MTTAEQLALGDLSTPEAFFHTAKAERACMETYLRYFDVVDRKLPYEQATGCFTEDADIEYHMKGEPLRFHGRAEYGEFMQTSLAAQEMSAHFAGQHRFLWTDGTPRLCSYVMSWQWFTINADQGDLRPADFATIGYAEDDFDCIDGVWLIARRVVKPVAGLTAVGGLPFPPR